MYNYNSGMYNDSYNNFLVGLGSILMILLFLILLICIVSIVANWKLFKKAGKNGWEALIPYYSSWVLTEISGLNSWWFWLTIASSIVSMFRIEFLSLPASLASYFAYFNIGYNIAKKFDKTNGEAVCAGIFWPIFVLIFGFSKKAIYNQNASVSKNGVFPDSNVNNVVVETKKDSDIEEQKEPIEKAEVMFCRNCGTKFESDAKFCPACGKERI